MDRKHCRKRRNWLYQAISPFPTVFSKDLYCKHVKAKACLGKDQYNSQYSTCNTFILHHRVNPFLQDTLLGLFLLERLTDGTLYGSEIKSSKN